MGHRPDERNRKGRHNMSIYGKLYDIDTNELSLVVEEKGALAAGVGA